MEKSEFLRLASLDYDQWSASQQDQTDAYEYERSFDELMSKLGNRLLQMSIGEVPTNERKKNDSHSLRSHRSGQGSPTV